MMLQYRTPHELVDAREGIASMLVELHGISVSADMIAITAGNSAALGMLLSNSRLRRASVGSDSLPLCVVENPTYFLARNILLDAGVAPRAIPIDEHGMRVDMLEAMCAAGEVPRTSHLSGPNP